MRKIQRSLKLKEGVKKRLTKLILFLYSLNMASIPPGNINGNAMVDQNQDPIIPNDNSKENPGAGDQFQSGDQKVGSESGQVTSMNVTSTNSSQEVGEKKLVKSSTGKVSIFIESESGAQTQVENNSPSSTTAPNQNDQIQTQIKLDRGSTLASVDHLLSPTKSFKSMGRKSNSKNQINQAAQIREYLQVIFFTSFLNLSHCLIYIVPAS
jgi:hypothetical protein